jgi:hypothetical protein
MAYTLEKLPDEPIIILTVRDPLGTPAEHRKSHEEIVALINTIEGDVYRITDMRELNITFAQMVDRIAQEGKARAAGAMSDERIKGIVVGSHDMVRFGTQAVSQQQYGGLKVPLFETLNEALTYARTEIGKTELVMN